MIEPEERDPVPRKCPSEGALLRRLDGTLLGEEREDVLLHLERCAACRGRLEALEARDRAVREWIRRHDPDPPPRDVYGREEAGPAGRRRSSRGGRWALAAGVVLALAVGALSGSVLGRILDREPLPPEPASVDPVQAPAATAATSFVPAGPELVLAFASPRTRGRVSIETSTDSTVSLSVPSGAVELTVEAETVRVRNAADASGLYRLRLPPAVRTVRIRVPGARERVVDVTSLTGERTVRLPT